jgi:cell division protein ZapE
MTSRRSLRLLRDVAALLTVGCFMFPLFWWGLNSIKPADAIFEHRGVVWFDFEALCEGPRAVADYIELARDFHTVLLSGLPQLEAVRDNAARRFVHLVDEFYDRAVNLVAASAVPIVELYVGERLRHEYERTTSRLIEMQSEHYLGREHRG